MGSSPTIKFSDCEPPGWFLRRTEYRPLWQSRIRLVHYRESLPKCVKTRRLMGGRQCILAMLSFLLIDANPIILFHRLGVVEYLRDTDHLIVEFQEQRRSGDNPPSRQSNSNPLTGEVSSITTNRIGGKQVLNYRQASTTWIRKWNKATLGRKENRIPRRGLSALCAVEPR
jgi:hypothetical protein